MLPIVPRLRALCATLFVGLLLVLCVSPAASQSSEWPVVEFRQYTLKPGQTDTLISLFESEFIDSQDAVGMKIFGTFRDLDRPDRFVWIRAFKDMSSRADALTAFYTGPVWKAHGRAAAATMLDSTNVLLLHDAQPASGFNLAGIRPSNSALNASPGLIVANIYYFDTSVDQSFVETFDRTAMPELEAAGISVLARYVSETAPNNYPALPVREKDRVFVWFARSTDLADYERRIAVVTSSIGWRPVAARLKNGLNTRPEAVHLAATSRSLIRD